MFAYPVGKPSIEAEEIQKVVESLQKSQLTMGANVRDFENRWANWVGSRHAVLCSSGTAALHLALVAAKIAPGDEVLVPNLTYVSTANAVSYVGARVVLVDIEAETWTIDLKDAAKKITPRTRAIIPVHIYGVPCDMDKIDTFAAMYGLKVIEDAAEAIGGKWKERALGSLGLMGMFSFYANKVITTGEGGAIVTNDDELANTLRFFRGQAQSPTKRFFHEAVGFNYRITDIQAAIGIAQFEKINVLLAKRHFVVDLYKECLGDILYTPNVEGSAPWLYTGVSSVPYIILEEELKRRGIEVRPMFVPMHRLPMYTTYDVRFPVSSKLYSYGISLPTYPDLSAEDVLYISTQVREVIYESSRRRHTN